MAWEVRAGWKFRRSCLCIKRTGDVTVEAEISAKWHAEKRKIGSLEISVGTLEP